MIAVMCWFMIVTLFNANHLLDHVKVDSLGRVA